MVLAYARWFSGMNVRGLVRIFHHQALPFTPTFPLNPGNFTGYVFRGDLAQIKFTQTSHCVCCEIKKSGATPVACDPRDGKPTMTLNLKLESRHIAWLLGTLIAIEVLIVSIYVATTLSSSPSQLRVLFNLDDEANIPSWFSSVQLFSIGAVLLLATASPLRNRDHVRGLLAVLGAGFIFLSMDEAAVIHEKVTTVLARVSWTPRFSGGHGIWIFVYA